MEFEVTEAPPSIKGNTAQGGTKLATIEGGAKDEPYRFSSAPET